MCKICSKNLDVIFLVISKYWLFKCIYVVQIYKDIYEKNKYKW